VTGFFGGGVDSCTGAVPVTGGVTPNPGNVVQVILAPNTAFGAIGLGNLAGGATISAVYNRFPALGAATFSAGTAPIAIIQPVYAIVLTVNNGTITANLPSQNTAATPNSTSVITATFYHSSTTPCQVVTGVSGFICGSALFNGTTGTLAGGTTLGTAALLYFQPGIEPSVITFQSSLGVFVATSQLGSVISTNSFAQTVSVQCGSQSGTTPAILQPTLGQLFNIGIFSCTTATATLAGGGEAGSAVVVVTSIGDYTGTTAQASTTVNLVPGPTTVNLTTGCNEVITSASLAPGSNSAAVLKYVSGFSVSSIWVFNNATHTFQAFYFSTANAPVDLSAVGPNQSIFICGTGAGTFQTSG
jgi:hypothetical protein